jgi:hypothetical protein
LLEKFTYKEEKELKDLLELLEDPLKLLFDLLTSVLDLELLLDTFSTN